MDLPIRRALLSVSDKSGMLELARQLVARGVVLLSTGGTARALTDAGIAVREVADFTGFPEIMAGRVKTLHPKIHGGLLGRRGTDDAVMASEGILPIDLLVVNLYPFAATVAKPDASYDEAIENIDVGGPAMLRGAAKNHADVTVVVDPADYPGLLAELGANGGGTRFEFRARLAAKAFAHTAIYDALVADYLARAHPIAAEPFPVNLGLGLTRIAALRYGENPHQRAAFYRNPGAHPDSIAGARFAQGKELSFNNIADADAALECVRQFERPACVIVKHANPCGVAVANDLATAYDLAYRTDPTSAFGGIIAFNRPLDVDTAQQILARQFVEVIVAPELLPGSPAALAAKPNVRVLVTGPLQAHPAPARELRGVGGGVLAQERDGGWITADDLKCVTKRNPTPQERRDLLFAWRVCKFVKSNAIVFARDEATAGIGAGQMSRVYSSRIGAIKAEDAGLTVRGAVMASDAFFPFRDGVEVAARQGVTAVIQPGGSMRDSEVIAAANEAGIAMLFTACGISGIEQQALQVLVIGGGGREHALAWKCAQSPRVAEVLVAPGNAGTARESRVRNVPIGAEQLEQLAELAAAEEVALTIVGPEVPLVAGIVDLFEARGLPCFGPRKAPAQLEGSKVFTKEFLLRHHIPTAGYRKFTRENFDAAWLATQRTPIVVKASGLAAGKGVIIALTAAEAVAAAESMLAGRFGDAGDEIVIEEFLEGEEASFIVMCDGKHVLPMASSQDHKRLQDGDAGPNTGGMGAYSPAPVVTPQVHARIMREVIEPTVRGLADDGMPFTGFLYAGLMIDARGAPKVIEYNVRFGDPETQPVLSRLRSDLTVLCEAALAGRLDTVTADWDPRAALGVVMAAHGYPDEVRKGDVVDGLERAGKLQGKLFHAGTAIKDGAVVTSGGRVFCAVGLGGSVATAQRAAYALVDAVQFPGAQTRRDIGYRAIEREQGH